MQPPAASVLGYSKNVGPRGSVWVYGILFSFVSLYFFLKKAPQYFQDCTLLIDKDDLPPFPKSMNRDSIKPKKSLKEGMGGQGKGRKLSVESFPPPVFLRHSHIVTVNH